MVVIEVTGKFPAGVDQKEIHGLVASAYRKAGGRKKVSVSLSIVTDAVMIKLNKRHRGKSKTTDVLSFAYDEAPFVGLKSVKENLLGDIIISLPQVARQAKAIGRPVGQEFCLMVVHGMLHLMGYDHETVAQEKKMFGLQQEILMRSKII